jgi:hypothetical protein
MSGDISMAEKIARAAGILRAVKEYPPMGHSRRNDNGYPAEVVYDEYAYQRIVDTYRESIGMALEMIDAALSQAPTHDR